jgi:hypothetical protein
MGGHGDARNRDHCCADLVGQPVGRTAHRTFVRAGVVDSRTRSAAAHPASEDDDEASPEFHRRRFCPCGVRWRFTGFTCRDTGELGSDHGAAARNWSGHLERPARRPGRRAARFRRGIAQLARWRSARRFCGRGGRLGLAPGRLREGAARGLPPSAAQG